MKVKNREVKIEESLRDYSIEEYINDRLLSGFCEEDIYLIGSKDNIEEYIEDSFNYNNDVIISDEEYEEITRRALPLLEKKYEEIEDETIKRIKEEYFSDKYTIINTLSDLITIAHEHDHQIGELYYLDLGFLLDTIIENGNKDRS